MGADRRLPWGLLASVDLLYSRDVNGWYTTDTNLMPMGNNSEGRPVYGASARPHRRDRPHFAPRLRVPPDALAPAVKVYNGAVPASNGTVALSKFFEEGIRVDAAYTYSNAADRIRSPARRRSRTSSSNRSTERSRIAT